MGIKYKNQINTRLIDMILSENEQVEFLEIMENKQKIDEKVYEYTEKVQKGLKGYVIGEISTVEANYSEYYETAYFTYGESSKNKITWNKKYFKGKI